MGAGPWSASPSTTRPCPSSLTASNGSVTCRKPRSSGIWVSTATRSRKGQTFSSYENQISGRFAWVPILSPDGGNLLHIGVSDRYGKTEDGKLRLKARPGAWAAPFFVDTAEFDASHIETDLDRDVLAAPFGYGGWGILLPERGRASVGRPVFPRRRSLRDMAHHRRDAHLQPSRRLLQSGLPLPARSSPAGPAPGRSWRTARSWTSTTRRSRGASTGA